MITKIMHIFIRSGNAFNKSAGFVKFNNSYLNKKFCDKATLKEKDGFCFTKESLLPIAEAYMVSHLTSFVFLKKNWL